MIDKNARLFGKVNIIDLLIVLGVAAIVAFAVAQIHRGRYIPAEEEEEMHPFLMEFFMDLTEDFIAHHVHRGDEVWDSGRIRYIGEITHVEAGDSVVWTFDMYGNPIRTTRPGMYSLRIWVHAYAAPLEGDAIIIEDGIRFVVGQSFTIHVGSRVVNMRLSGLQQLGPTMQVRESGLQEHE